MASRFAHGAYRVEFAGLDGRVDSIAYPPSAAKVTALIELELDENGWGALSAIRVYRKEELMEEWTPGSAPYQASLSAEDLEAIDF